MKKMTLIKKTGIVSIALLSASTLIACGHSGTKYDGGAYAKNGANYYTEAAIAPQSEEYEYDYSDDLYGYENGDYDYGTTTSAPGSGQLNESQLGASVSKNRKLIKTVDLTVETTAFEDMLNKLDAEVKKYGGYIENEYSYNGSKYGTSTQTRYATIKIRIPDDKLDDFVSGVGGIGSVTSKSTSTNDITLNYVDTESRKEMLLAQQESLLALLEKADSIEDVVYLTEELSQIRYEIESMESTLRVYDDLVSYATVNVSITEVAVLTPTVVEEKTPGQVLKEGFTKNVQAVLVDVRDGFINFLIATPQILRVLITLAIIFGIIYGVIRIIIAIIKKKSKKNKAAKEADKEEKKPLIETLKDDSDSAKESENK